MRMDYLLSIITKRSISEMNLMQKEKFLLLFFVVQLELWSWKKKLITELTLEKWRLRIHLARFGNEGSDQFTPFGALYPTN